MFTRRLLFFCLLGWLPSLLVQGQANPFELQARLPEVTSSDSSYVATGNPFDLHPDLGLYPAGPSGVTPAAAPENRNVRGPLIIQPTDPNEGKGSLLAIHIILLLSLAGLWLTFSDFLRECLRGMFNDGLMNQLYNRRASSALGALWICYVFFFLATGYFLYLFSTYYDISLGQGIWGGWLTYSLAVAAAVGLKNVVLVLLANIFPVQREVSRYVFMVMVFCILIGLLFAPINLLVSYAPQNYRKVFILLGVGVAVIIYLLHLLRGVFIANRLLATRPVHILLYICAIEIAPLLLIYRYLGVSIA